MELYEEEEKKIKSKQEKLFRSIKKAQYKKMLHKNMFTKCLVLLTFYFTF